MRAGYHGKQTLGTADRAAYLAHDQRERNLADGGAADGGATSEDDEDEDGLVRQMMSMVM